MQPGHQLAGQLSRSAGWEIDSPLCFPGKKSACVVLGKMHSPSLLPEEGTEKALKSIIPKELWQELP